MKLVLNITNLYNHNNTADIQPVAFVKTNFNRWEELVSLKDSRIRS